MVGSWYGSQKIPPEKRPWLRFVCPQVRGKGYLFARKENWTKHPLNGRLHSTQNPQVKAYSLVGGRYVNIWFLHPPKFHSSRTWKIMGKVPTTWTTWLVRKFSWANGETLPGSKSEIPMQSIKHENFRERDCFAEKNRTKNGGLRFAWLSWLAEVRRDLGMAESPYITLKVFFFGDEKVQPKNLWGLDIRCPHWLQLVHLDDSLVPQNINHESMSLIKIFIRFSKEKTNPNHLKVDSLAQCLN